MDKSTDEGGTPVITATAADGVHDETREDPVDWSQLPLIGDYPATKIERIKNFMTPLVCYFDLLNLVREHPDKPALKTLLAKEEINARTHLTQICAILKTI